jgi:AAA domain
MGGYFGPDDPAYDPMPGENVRPFPTVDLAELAKQGILPPEFLCDGLLYLGMLHSLAGPPDSGKSTLLYYWIAILIAAGRTVILIDEECGREVATEKLMALNATPEHLERLAYVEFPARQWDDPDRLGLWHLIEDRQATFIGYDSSAALLSAGGKDEDKSRDTLPFYKLLLQTARRFQVASVVIDHVGKNQQGGRYARGSGSKLGAVDVAYMVDCIRPFSRTQSGLLRLTVSKDRRGYLHRDWEAKVETENGPIGVSITKIAKDAKQGYGPAADKLLQVLRASTRPLTNSELVDRVKDKFGHGLRRETASRILNNLLSDRFVDCAEDGGRRYWSALTPAEGDQQ